MLLSSCYGEPLKKLVFKGQLLFLEVDQVLVVFEDPDVSEGAPRILNFLSSNRFSGLLLYFLFSLLVASPRPLNLDGSNMIHSEAMVFKESPSERHLVCRLDQTSAEVTHAFFLSPTHVVESWCQEFLSERLARWKALHLLATAVLGYHHLPGLLWNK